MCGIAGIYGLEGLVAPEVLVGRMNEAMAHRGPDAGGVWRGSNVVLGHRRLSIIDLSASAHQPFLSTDGRTAIVFNGEIYNFRELRRELETGEHPHTFRTNSDTEVLLAAYGRWGTDMLPRLHGMFAFAIMDEERQELLLARDRMGIKPLYIYRGRAGILFASELRALLATGLVPRTVDPDALVDHLRYQTVHAPNTLVKDVHMLEAGHAWRITDQEVHAFRWYDLVGAVQRDAEHMDLPDIHRQVREKLARAVERRMLADVPFGAFLSGGIDSSAVVGLMAQASSAPVHTFSVVFDEAEFSEEQYARIVASRFNTRHTAIRLLPRDMLRMLPDALAAMDHPSADGPNTYVVSKVTKEAGITMALSGLGGDEVFAGYPVFTRTLALWKLRWITQFPRWMRGSAAQLLAAARPSIASAKTGELLRLGTFSVDDTYPVSRLTTTDGELVRLLKRDTLPRNRVQGIMHQIIRSEGGHALPFLGQVSLGELATYLQNVLLRDTDQMSMAHALEVRVPFLDHELVEFVLGVGDGNKYPHTPKELLVNALGDLLPSQIVHRPKMGFTLPWELWMRNELRAFCEERLMRLDRREAFRQGAVHGLWQRFLRGDPRVNWSRIWSLVVLEEWSGRNGMDY